MSVAVGAKSGGRGFVRGNGVVVLAWISFGFAVVGGAALMASAPGHWLAGLIGLFPAWVSALAVMAGVITLGIDLALDGTPNRAAVWSVILLPSVALAVNGRLGENVRHLADVVSGSASARFGEWIGQGSPWVIAAASITAALLMAKRVIRKGGG